MTGPIAEQAAAVQKLVADAGKLWVDAAHQSDSADGLGIDGRISLVHGLVDLWVKSYAAWLDAIIKSGACLPGQSQPSHPLPSEVVEVTPQAYARTIACDGPFVRVGLPTITIPPSALAFDPPFLPAGLTRIRIVLKDQKFIGSNFTGKIKLTRMPDPSGLAQGDAAPEEKVVTVGL